MRFSQIESNVNILIVTLYTPEIESYGVLTSENKVDYAKRHNYECSIYGRTLDPSRPPAWSKIKALQMNMDSGFDWLFWTDADSVITRLDVPLERFIDDAFNAIWCRDLDREYPCTGQMLVRCCEAIKEFLEQVWKQDQFTNHHWWEQAAIGHLLKTGYPLKHKLLDPRAFNSFAPEFKAEKEARYHTTIGPEYFWQPGDFMCHVLGDRGKKYERVKGYLSKSK